MKLVLTSDPHTKIPLHLFPHGDLLIVAGDCTYHRNASKNAAEQAQFESDVVELAKRYELGVVVIPGNHDFTMQEYWRDDKDNKVKWLAERGVTLTFGNELIVRDGYNILGIPHVDNLRSWAFSLPAGNVWENFLDNGWSSANIDILVTHQPAIFCMDRAYNGECLGSFPIRKIREILKPKLHVFGHIHEQYGYSKEGGTLCVLPSLCDREYRQVNPPIVVNLSHNGAEVVKWEPEIWA